MNTEESGDAGSHNLQSSNELLTKVRAVLQENSHLRSQQSHLTIEQSGKTIILEGRLPSFHLKQVLQEEVRKIPGVEMVVNRTVVVSRSE